MGVTWPNSLQSLSFGYDFNQALEGVVWPSSLQSLSFDTCFSQSLEGVEWPSNLQSLSFKGNSSHGTRGRVTMCRRLDEMGEVLPRGLRSLDFWESVEELISISSEPFEAKRIDGQPARQHAVVSREL